MEKIKLTDNLFIYRDENKKDRLVYIVDLSKDQYRQILNMKEVENNVNEAVQKYIKFLNKYIEKNSHKNMLFIFLLKVKLYEEYILRNLLGHLLFNEYEQLMKDNRLAYYIARYLLNKEVLSERDKFFIKNFIEDINTFRKLYLYFRDITFGMPKDYIINLYERFIFTLEAENILI